MAAGKRLRHILRRVIMDAVMIMAFIIMGCHAEKAEAANAQELRYLRQMSELSKQSTDSLYSKSEALFMSSRPDSAMNMLSIVCSRYSASEPEERQRLYAGAFDRYGVILFRRGAYAHAMDNLLRARFIAEKYKFRDLQRRVYADIGIIFAASGKYNDAIQFFKRSLALTTLKEDSVLYPNLLNNLFTANYLKGNMAEAEKYAARYKAGCQSYPRYEFDTNLSEGMLSLHRGQTQKAIAAYRRALAEAVQRGYTKCEESACTGLMDAFEKAKRQDSATYYGRRALSIAGSLDDDRLEVEAMHALADLFARAGMVDSAYFYKGRYLALSDSISYLEDVNKIENSVLIYELDASSAVIKNLSADNSLKMWLLISALVVIVAFGVLVVRLVMQNRKLKEAQETLYKNSSKQLAEQQRYEKRIKQLDSKLENICAATNEENEGGEVSEGEGEKSDSMAAKMVSDDMREKIVADVLRVLETTKDYCSCNYSLEQLASDIGFNPRYVSEVINQDLGKNFRTLVNEYRIRVAMSYLEDFENYGHLTLKSISESVGYKSQTTFISAFTKITGLKPNTYQRLAMENKLKGHNATDPDDDPDDHPDNHKS